MQALLQAVCCQCPCLQYTKTEALVFWFFFCNWMELFLTGALLCCWSLGSDGNPHDELFSFGMSGGEMPKSKPSFCTDGKSMGRELEREMSGLF